MGSEIAGAFSGIVLFVGVSDVRFGCMGHGNFGIDFLHSLPIVSVV